MPIAQHASPSSVIKKFGISDGGETAKGAIADLFQGCTQSLTATEYKRCRDVKHYREAARCCEGVLQSGSPGNPTTTAWRWGDGDRRQRVGLAAHSYFRGSLAKPVAGLVHRLGIQRLAAQAVHDNLRDHLAACSRSILAKHERVQEKFDPQWIASPHSRLTRRLSEHGWCSGIRAHSSCDKVSSKVEYFPALSACRVRAPACLRAALERL